MYGHWFIMKVSSLARYRSVLQMLHYQWRFFVDEKSLWTAWLPGLFCLLVLPHIMLCPCSCPSSCYAPVQSLRYQLDLCQSCISCPSYQIAPYPFFSKVDKLKSSYMETTKNKEKTKQKNIKMNRNNKIRNVLVLNDRACCTASWMIWTQKFQCGCSIFLFSFFFFFQSMASLFFFQCQT